jgi:hypothetical protein
VVQQIVVVVDLFHSAYLCLDELSSELWDPCMWGNLGKQTRLIGTVLRAVCRSPFLLEPADVHRFSASSGAVERQLRAMNAALETLLDVLLELHDIRSALVSPGLGPEEVCELRARRAHLPLRVESVGDDFADALSERMLSADEVVAVWRRACRVSELVAWDRVWERTGQ